MEMTSCRESVLWKFEGRRDLAEGVSGGNMQGETLELNLP